MFYAPIVAHAGFFMPTGHTHRATSCCPPSMSYVAPVRAVLIMMCTASAATSPLGRRAG